MFFVFTQFVIPQYGQNFEREFVKYWYYRDRLQYFVYPGTEKGESIIMTCRNGCKDFTDSYPPYFSIEFAQTHKLMGYYIGVLATEYKLLINNGQISDALSTLNELDMALEALNRMDMCESDAPWFSEAILNGFFIRNDVPPVLSLEMSDGLNKNCRFGTYQDYFNFIEVEGYKGMPFGILNNAVGCTNMYESSLNYFYQFPDAVFDRVSYNLHGTQYWSYWKQQNFTSSDEIIGDYLGLSLVAELVDDELTKQKAIEIAERYLSIADGIVDTI